MVNCNINYRFIFLFSDLFAKHQRTVIISKIFCDIFLFYELGSKVMGYDESSGGFFKRYFEDLIYLISYFSFHLLMHCYFLQDIMFIMFI